MGYAQTTIVMYGIRIDSELAQRIYEHLNINEGSMEYEENHIIKEPSYVHRGVQVYRDRYYPNLIAEDADSRIHDMSFEEGFSHVFGIHCCSNGYAYEDVIEDYLTPHQVAINNFERYCKPVLDELGINLEPSILICSQVW